MDWIKRLLSSVGRPSFPLPDAEPRPAEPTANPPPVYTRYVFDDPTVRIAAVGDLHGRIDLLRQLGTRLDTFAQDRSKRLIEVYLGDYLDRGGDGRAVIEFLAHRSAMGDRDVICLAGNHEQMMLAALESDKDFLSWLGFGGQPTMLSYGVSPAGAKADPARARGAFRAALPAGHLEFLKRLGLTYRRGGFFFTHAGVKPGRALEQQLPSDLLWIRDEFLRSSANFGAVVVHGHTPVTRPVFRPNRIGIDTGAYYSGRLTCLLVTSESVSTLDTARVPEAA